MKIGMMLPVAIALQPRGDGVRVQAWRQAEALQKLGHEVIQLNPWQFTESLSLDWMHFFIGGFPLYLIERTKPNLVRRLAFAPIIDSNEPFWRYRLAAKLGQMFPRIHTVQGECARQARGSDLVIVRSTHEQQRVIRSLGADPRKVHIVLNGVNPVEHADAEGARRKLDLPRDFVLHVSAYTQERKNVVRLLEAVGPLGYPIVIGGTAEPGPIYDRIKELARQYPQVRLLGYIDQPTLDGLYAACRVFALPTYHEGTGLVALEAAALGARIIVTKNGGPPDYFLDMAEYVDPFSVESIRAAIVKAWESPASNALREHVVNNLTWKQSAEALVRAYEAAMHSEHA